MANALALVAVAIFASAYGAWSTTMVGGNELLGLTLSAGIIVLIVSGLGAHLWGSRNGLAPDRRPLRWLIFRNLAFAVSTAAIVAAAAFSVAGRYDTPLGSLIAQVVAVGLLAGAVAYGELISRYRDSPGDLLTANPTATYVCVNIAADMAALALVKEFHVFTSPDHKLVYEAMLAGFGAIAFFRTSLFTVRVSGTDVGIGPSTLLRALLDSSDMMLNRWQGYNRGLDVTSIMKDVDFAKAKAALPALCFTLMQEFSPEVQAKVAEAIKNLALDTTIEPAAKSTILGVYMIQQVGAEVLRRAVDSLGTSVK